MQRGKILSIKKFCDKIKKDLEPILTHYQGILSEEYLCRSIFEETFLRARGTEELDSD